MSYGSVTPLGSLGRVANGGHQYRMTCILGKCSLRGAILEGRRLGLEASRVEASRVDACQVLGRFRGWDSRANQNLVSKHHESLDGDQEPGS